MFFFWKYMVENQTKRRILPQREREREKEDEEGER